MESTEPVVQGEPMELPDDKNHVVTPALPDKGWLASNRSVRDLVMPVGLDVESAVIDSLSSVSFAEDWLTGFSRNQEKLMGSLLPSGLSMANRGLDILPAADKAMSYLDSIQGFREDLTSVTIPGILGSSKVLHESVVTGNTMPGLHDDLRGLRDHFIGVAKPDNFGAVSLAREMAGSMDSVVGWSGDLQRFQDHFVSVAMRDDFGAVSFAREMAAGVNMTAAWADRVQVYREEVVGFGDSWMRHVKPMLERSKSFAELYWKDKERFRSCCMKLGHRGWFLDPQMPMSLLWYIADTIEESPEVTDELLIQWFQGRLNEIEEELIKACPRRALLLRSAFKAHRDRDYNISVPAFLKEADGMWYDLFGMNVFIARARKSIVKTIEGRQPYGLIYSSLVPLLQSTLPLWMNENERQRWMKMHRTDVLPGLNRHEILHGISVDYGTETNSLKAISFLNWRLLVELVVRDTQ